MLRRSWIILTEMLVVGVVVVTGVLFWASYYVDTDEFRERFVYAVERITGRPAVLRGELNIALYPSISLEVLGLTVKGEPEFGDSPLMEFDKLRASVRIIPLFSRRIEIRTIVVEGMTVNVVRTRDGLLNWQSVVDRLSALASRPEPGEGQIEAVSLSGLEVIDAKVSYSDMQKGDKIFLKGIDIRTGAISSGESVPFSATSQFNWRNEGVESKIVLKGMLEAGNRSGLRLKDATIYATAGGEFLPVGANPGEMVAKVVMDWEKRAIALDDVSIRFLGLRAEGRITSGNLDKGLSASGSLELRPFVPAEIISRYYPKAPVQAVDGLKKGSFKSDFEIDESGFFFKNLTTSLDDLKVKGSLAVKGYAKPRLEFTLSGGSLDLDRYIPLFETGTPFIWDDFNLAFFGALRGRGTARLASFKVLGRTLNGLRLAVDASANGLAADAGGKLDAGEQIDGRGVFRIGTSETAKMPTLGIDLDLNVNSPKEGFSFLENDSVAISGAGRLHAKLKVAAMDCPPQTRSIGLLRRLKGEATVILGEGKGEFSQPGKEKYSLGYSTAECALKFSPMKGQGDEYFGFNADVSVRGQGGSPVRTFAFSAKGPVVTAVDKMHVRSSGLHTRNSVSGALYTGLSSRVAANGLVSFDTEKHTLGIKDAMIRTLETTVRGDASFTDLHKSFKGSGQFEIPGANVRRMVFLLTKFAVRTKDTEALKAISLTSKFDLDEFGFRLSELEGKMDGVSFNGHVVGQGLKNPKLVFSLAAGEFDLDRYLPPSTKPSVEERRAGKVHKAPPVDLPLAFLRMLRLSGKVWFEEFKLAKIRVRDLSGHIDAEMGKIRVSKVKGKVHDGTLTADWKGDVGLKSLTTDLKLHIEDMQAAPLMIDMAEREYLRGETDVNFDLVSSGATDDDILKNLHGKAWGRIRNGSFKFTGFEPKKSTSARGEHMTSHLTPEQQKRRTVFHKTMAYFTVKQGVFKVDKFRVEAPPLLQSYGTGQFSLPDDTIDLSIRNDFVAVPSVTMRIIGKLSDPEVKVPKDKIVNDTVRNILSLPEKSFEFLRDLFK